jgi:hydrogenase maturation protein HypF
MAEHGLCGPVIGLSLDGTGYGTDGKIWGGEVLICRFDCFERFAHLDYVPMPGGEAAVKQPWRMAFGALRAAGFDVGSNEILELLGAQKSEVRVLTQMIERGVNTPLTSSCGRLFDAAAVLVLGRRVVDYEAQAAIELEGVAGEDEVESEPGYATQFIAGNWVAREPARICAGPLWWELMHDLQRGVSTSKISARFHTGVAEGFAKAAIVEAACITGAWLDNCARS